MDWDQEWSTLPEGHTSRYPLDILLGEAMETGGAEASHHHHPGADDPGMGGLQSQQQDFLAASPSDF